MRSREPLFEDEARRLLIAIAAAHAPRHASARARAAQFVHRRARGESLIGEMNRNCVAIAERFGERARLLADRLLVAVEIERQADDASRRFPGFDLALDRGPVWRLRVRD